jgi:RNA polymerase sigma-70 factor, ECF subfamily
MSWKPDNSSKGSDEGLSHIDDLFRYAMILTRNRVEAEGLVQETFLRSIKDKSTFAQSTNFKGWLFTILRSIWFDQLRARRNRLELGFLEDDTGAFIQDRSKDERLDSIAEQDLVRETIEQLPRLFSEIILLREYEGLSYKEIADLLNCAEGTIMSRISRARVKLRELLMPKIDALTIRKYRRG